MAPAVPARRRRSGKGRHLRPKQQRWQVEGRVPRPSNHLATKETGKGSGLGLSQGFGFAKQAGGWVRIQSELGRSTAIEHLLGRGPTSARCPTACSRRETKASATILADDDQARAPGSPRPPCVSSATRLLQAGSGGAALELPTQLGRSR